MVQIFTEGGHITIHVKNKNTERAKERLNVSRMSFPVNYPVNAEQLHYTAHF